MFVIPCDLKVIALFGIFQQIVSSEIFHLTEQLFRELMRSKRLRSTENKCRRGL